MYYPYKPNLMEKKTIYNYHIEKISSEDFQSAAPLLVERVAQKYSGKLLRVTFFGGCATNEIYNQQKDMLKALLESGFSTMPLWGYVIEHSFDSTLVAEVMITDAILEHKSHQGVAYVTTEASGVKELFTGGLSSHTDKTIAEQSSEIFDNLSAILSLEGFKVSDIVRQWNYIERIVDFEGEFQHYQIFNDVRSSFYSTTQWPVGYPAATGIGMQRGGVIVEINAIQGAENYASAIDNSLQIAAHEYSQSVLVGAPHESECRTTPKFERAKTVSYSGNSDMLYISGTAAIQGEDSIPQDDVISQCKVTLENIDNLISGENRTLSGDKSQGEAAVKLYRVYIKEEEDAAPVIEYMNSRYPNVEISFIMADVCRTELLIEIEGIAILEN